MSDANPFDHNAIDDIVHGRIRLGVMSYLSAVESALFPELRDKVGLPLLGVVSFVMSDTDVRREKVSFMRFWVASGALLGLFAAGLTAMTLLANR